MNENRIALFDLDGTLADHNGAMEQDYKKIMSPDEDISVLRTIHPPSYVRTRIDLIRSQRDWWTNLAEIPSGMELYRKIKEIGFQNYVLTKGPWSTPHAWTEKVLWVRKHLDPDVKIVIAEDKSVVYGRVLVDDWVPYIKSWLSWRHRGIVIMPVHTYNKDFSHPNVIPWDGTNMNVIEEALLKAYNR